jgi:hypothetical protein
MQDTMKMAGEVASHALWSVSDGAMLTPLLGYLDSDRSRRMERIAMGSAQAVAYGSRKLEAPAPGTLGTVFVKDGIVTLPTGRCDALIVTIGFSDDPAKRFELLVPYRNARHTDGFAVHRLKLTQKTGIADDQVEGLFDAFVTGLESHEQGGRLWKEKYVDQAGDTAGSAGEESTDFTEEEFALLKRAVFHLLQYVGRADGKLNFKEFAALKNILREPERFGSPLLNRLATNTLEGFSNWCVVASVANERVHLEELTEAREIVNAKLSAEESRTFRRALLDIATEIARASGGWFSKSKISSEEQRVLGCIASALGLGSQ